MFNEIDSHLLGTYLLGAGFKFGEAFRGLYLLFVASMNED